MGTLNRIELKINVNQVEAVYIFVSLLAFIFCLFDFSISYKVYELIAISVFVALFISTLKYRNFSLYQVFLVTFFIFLLSRPTLDLFGAYDLSRYDMFRSFTISNDVLCKTIKVITIYLIGSSYAWLLSSKDVTTYYFIASMDRKQLFDKAIKILFYVYFVIFILKILYTIRFVASTGYLFLFTGEISEESLPFIFKGSGTITEVLFCLILYYNRDKKPFMHFSAFYLIISGFRIFTGQRATSLLMFLFVIYMYSTYHKELKMISAKTIGFVLAISVMVEFIAQFRIGTTITFESLLTSNFIYLMLANLGVSVNVVSGTIMFRDSMTNRFPFILSYFTDIFTRTAGQSLERITSGNYLGDHLTYTLSNAAYLTGRGTGTSIVAEVFDFCEGNLFLIAIVSFIISYLVLLVCNKAYKSLYRFMFSYFLAIDFIFSPRWSVFKSITSIAFALVVACLITIFEKRTSRVD